MCGFSHNVARLGCFCNPEGCLYSLWGRHSVFRGPGATTCGSLGGPPLPPSHHKSSLSCQHWSLLTSWAQDDRQDLLINFPMLNFIVSEIPDSIFLIPGPMLSTPVKAVSKYYSTVWCQLCSVYILQLSYPNRVTILLGRLILKVLFPLTPDFVYSALKIFINAYWIRKGAKINSFTG